MNANLLTLTQWLSPAFPVGSYAFSHGMEHAIHAGQVHDGCSTRDWLSVVVQDGAGAVDATLLCLALKGEQVADLARALAGSKERLEETEAQGAAFVATVNGVHGTDLPVMPLPVAVGVAAQRLCLEPAQVAALYLHSFASNLVSVAVRFVPLGQTEGQRILSDLHPLIETVAARAAEATVEDLGSMAAGADLSAMLHETMDVRLFKS